MNIDNLTTLSQLSDHISLCELDKLQVLRINHPKAKAAISLFGAHMLSFIPAGEKDLLWLSEKAVFNAEKPIRGGVPICWPWFGKAAEPAHGFARNQIWTLQEHSENQQGVILTLVLESNESTLKSWPHQFHLALKVEISEQLTLSLLSTNKSNETIEIGGALHSYFNIGDIKQTEITQLGEHYSEFGKEYTSDGSAEFKGEVDRIYTKAQSTTPILDKANNRVIDVQSSGNNSVVVWNPWSELSTSMADMADEGYQTMVCVESTIYDNKFTLAPNAQHSLTTAFYLKK